ncbi:TIGR04282 family arsenosugar biosynthesis glycosyltransferase [Sphingomonas sp. LHG3406-1]|uniref:TIGR04282 family arsenosugar biosynthesis glycosyltransferase n=1 Tax=Sphingomonas sp. LHG3406-1 TaxID=2804617 RepID=UPI00261C3CBE|nr:TIGR04282 family arsenosugar biosynthesis glycosyltransferase [Sphingomonas sp. LHG3406-1]
MSPVRLVIFTRYPEPGKAKTRLIPALGAEGAAALHRRLTERTLEAARASGLTVEVRTTGATRAHFAAWLGDDLLLADQGEGDLGERLRRAANPAPALFIGSDLPDLTAGHLVEAAARMRTSPAVLGPAEDGGYWALGLRQPSDYLFADMPWSSDQVFALTLERLRGRGIDPALLPLLADCDRPEDLDRWPDLSGTAA